MMQILEKSKKALGKRLHYVTDTNNIFAPDKAKKQIESLAGMKIKAMSL